MTETYAKILKIPYMCKTEEELYRIIEQFDQDLLPPFVLTVIRVGGWGVGTRTLDQRASVFLSLMSHQVLEVSIAD